MRKSALSLIACVSFMIFATSAHADIISYAESTNPLAFFPLQSSSQGSVVNGYTTTYNNGVGTVPSNGGPQANAASFNGVNSNTPEYISTSLSGGILSGSISAYINLAAATGSIEFIAGESQGGNDFDFQLVPVDGLNADLCFYTQSGSSTCALLAYTQLLDKWNLVSATDDDTTGTQDVYLNGVLVATEINGGNGAKYDQFNIGYTPTFGGRDFDGLISDVGIWNYALTATQEADLYNPPAAGPMSATPEPSSLALLALPMLSAVVHRVRRRRSVS